MQRVGGLLVPCWSPGEGDASLAGLEGAGEGSTPGKGSGSFPEAAESRFQRVTSLFI